MSGDTVLLAPVEMKSTVVAVVKSRGGVGLDQFLLVNCATMKYVSSWLVGHGYAIDPKDPLPPLVN